MHNCRRFFTARSSYVSAVLGIVILSLRPSVCLTHVCFVTKRKSILPIFLIPHERVGLITLVFLYQRRLVGDAPFHLKFALKWPTPYEKRRLRRISAYNVWTVRASDNSQLSLIGSPPRAFQRAIGEVRKLTLTPKKAAKKRICRFCE